MQFTGTRTLTLYQPMTHICVMSPVIIYMGGLILGVNTFYRLFCFFNLFPMVGKGLNAYMYVADLLVFLITLVCKWVASL